MNLQDFTEIILRNPTELVQNDLFYAQAFGCTGLQLQGYSEIINKLPREIIEVLKFDNRNYWLKGSYSDKNIGCEVILTINISDKEAK